MPFAIWRKNKAGYKFENKAKFSGENGLLNLFPNKNDLLASVPAVSNKSLNTYSVTIPSDTIVSFIREIVKPESKNAVGLEFLIQNNKIEISANSKNKFVNIYKVISFTLSFQTGHEFVSYLLNLKVIGEVDKDKSKDITDENCIIKPVKNGAIVHTFGYLKNCKLVKKKGPSFFVEIRADKGSKKDSKKDSRNATAPKPESVFIFEESMQFFKGNL